MRKFLITTEAGNEYVAAMTERNAREIAHEGSKVQAFKAELHKNPIMKSLIPSS